MEPEIVESTKFFERRDSATAALRRMGVSPSDYKLFIEQADSGRFMCLLDEARKHLDDRDKRRNSETDNQPEDGEQQVTNSTRKAMAKAAESKSAKAKTTEPKPAKAKVAKPKADPAEKKVSAAQLFKDLIMEGKLTDNQIFDRVSDQFGLDEKKRGYVKWYRNHLKKSGSNPPAAKSEK